MTRVWWDVGELGKSTSFTVIYQSATLYYSVGEFVILSSANLL